MDGLDFRVFTPFTKVAEQGDGSLLVETVVNDETVDDQGEILDYDAVRKASADYMRWAAVREMHGEHAAGSMVSLSHDDDTRTTTGIIKIVDSEAIRKVRAGVYKGTSMGGRKLARIFQKVGAQRVGRIVDLTWIETSLVDRPSRPTASLTILKRSDIAEADGFLIEDGRIVNAEEQMTKVADPAKTEEQADTKPAEQADTTDDTKVEKAAVPDVKAEEPKTDDGVTAKEDGETDSVPEDTAPEFDKMAEAIGARLEKAIEAGFAKMATSTPSAMIEVLEPAKPAEAIEKAAKTDDTKPAAVDPAAVGAYLVEHLSQSEIFAKAADVQAMKGSLAEALVPLQEEIAKVAAQPTPGGPLRYATDPRRFLEDTPEAQTGMSEALAKVASEAKDPAVREEVGRMAAQEEMRGMFAHPRQ